MSETQTKQFQYEIQDFQEVCVNNIITIFESLRQNISFNVLAAWRLWRILTDKLQSKNGLLIYRKCSIEAVHPP